MLKRKRDDADMDEKPGFHSPEELVTFIIGKAGEEKEFKIHKEFVCHHSKVLRAAFNNDGFIEGETQTYRLDDVTPSCFRLFVQFIYQHQFDVLIVKRADWQLEQKNGKTYLRDRVLAQDLELAQLWVLADKFLVPSLQNRVIDAFILVRSECWLYTRSWFRYVYENTSESSALREFAVRFAVSSEFDFKKDRKCFPKDMLCDMLEKTEFIARCDISRPFATDFYVKIAP